MTDKQKSPENESAVPPTPQALPAPITDELKLVAGQTEHLLQSGMPDLIDEGQGESDEDIEVEVIDSSATIDELNGICTRRPEAVDNAIAKLGEPLSSALIYEEDLTIVEFCRMYRVPVKVIEDIFHVHVTSLPEDLRDKK